MKSLHWLVCFMLIVCVSLEKASAANPGYATIKVEKFDPPVVLDNYNQLVELVTVRNLPGAPTLVLHVPCIRSKISPDNPMAAGRTVAPGVVEGCNAQFIPSGLAKGEWVNQHGEIFPLPGG